ncbi:MAG: peptidoglycan endopeptidase [Spirochaetota bacterium]
MINPSRTTHTHFILGFCLAMLSTTARAEPFDTAAAFATFADPADLWGTGVESVMEQAYRDCFRTYILGGRVITLRMPFAQNNEREELVNEDLAIEGGGKADPLVLWDQIDNLLDAGDFRSYMAALGDSKEKVVVFDLSSRSWSLSSDLFDIARMKAGAYRGLPHKPYVFTSGKGIEAADIYNYLYCIGRLGMDCSGFVWHILSATAKAGGLDLGRTLSRALRAPRGADPALYAGTSFFDSRSTELIQVKDELRNLLPGDVILFRGADGTAVHSAVIQSIDFGNGTLRYLQSTDEAPLPERGVHDSYIHFDPARPELSLEDPSLQWTQKRFPSFPGERPSAFSEDGERYRAYPEFGAGKVVRLKAMAAPMKRINARVVR